MASSNGEPPVVLTVSADLSGRSLLEFLSAQFLGQSKARLRRMIGAGSITVNGATALPRRIVWQGDTVALPPDVERQGPPPQTVPLAVLYEDDHLLCLNKPPGHTVLPGRGGRGADFYRSLMAHVNRSIAPPGPYLRPHVVHRLDRETSGVLLVAKTADAGRALGEQFAQRQVEKTYLAFCEGALPRDELRIDVPLGRAPDSPLKVRPDERHGKPAATRVRVRERFGHFSLLEVGLETGRQHQIRVHLAAIGYPLAVDGVYGRRDRLTGREFNAIVGAGIAEAQDVVMHRCPLHAVSIRYAHPHSGLAMAHTAPLPEDMQRFLALLERADRRG